MPLAQPLAELRQNLEAQIRENQLPDALNALLAQLPEGSETHRIISALIARLNAANKERYHNTISMEEYSRLVAQVRSDFFELIGGLTEADFTTSTKASASGKTAKLGSVLYRVPHLMRVQKPSPCTIRVAVDEDEILKNILLDEHVEIKSRVEISDVMSAELLDPEGGTFQISALSARTQLVKETGYTEWNFSVTPLIEGVHQLLVKVSILEKVEGFPDPIPREVSVMETVTIVTEGAAPSDAALSDFKPSGQTFAFQSSSTASGNYEVSYKGPMKGGEQPAPQPTNPPANPTYGQAGNPTHPPANPSSSRGLRAAALFLAFIVLAPAATWAFTPPVTRDWWVANLKDNADAYAEYIKEYRESGSPHLEKAFFYKADASGQLTDLRVYQQNFPQGKYREKVVDKVALLEIKSVESIRQQPDRLKIRQFVADFPESERLAELKQAVETRAELRAELLPVVEEAYVTSVQVQPTETKVAAYLRDFPKQGRLNDVAAAAAARPEVLEKARPALEEAITRKVEVATTAAEVRKVLPALESAGSSEAAAKVEKLVEQKPQIRKQVQQQVRQSADRVRQRETATPSPSKAGEMSEVERLDWETATQANTARAFVDFVNKYPKTTKLPEARAKIYALKPALSPEEKAWADATLANTPEAFIYFVQKYPGSARSTDARARIKTFSLSIRERKRLETEAAQRLRDEEAAEAERRRQQQTQGNSQVSEDSQLSESPAPDPARPRRSGIHDMVFVQGGTYTMGSPESEEGRDENECQHPVTVASFSIGKYEVTQADWREVMGKNPSELHNKGCDDCPVESVSRDDVKEFLKTLNSTLTGGQKEYRLLTEEEWEYAARGGNKSKGYKYAGSNDLNKVAWYSDNRENNNLFGEKRATHRVGELTPNELGLYDMLGNVYEWCQECKPYPGCSDIKSSGLRGSSWSTFKSRCRIAYRNDFTGSGRNNYVGFRLAR